jgi:ribosome-associated heat shock protein Hsp15
MESMKEPGKEVRIDKWLWAVRLFKTRSIAIEACKKGRISIKGVTIKPSRMIKVGDIIEVRRPPVTYSFEVLNLSENRMGAKLVPDFMKDVTSPSQLEILEMSKVSGFVDRARGTGRPTKKDRRELEQFTDDHSFFDDWDLGED